MDATQDTYMIIRHWIWHDYNATYKLISQ